MDTSSPGSLRERNKHRVRGRIIAAAKAVLEETGLERLSADDIAARAEVGRATFFRYFDSKEAALVVAFYEQRLSALVETLNAAPANLGPLDAIIWVFKQLETNVAKQLAMIRRQSRMLATSPALRAKALEFQASYTQAIADAVTPRYKQLGPHDLRPRLLAVTTLMVVTSVIDYWSAARGDLDLPQLVNSGLEQMRTGFSDDPDRAARRRA